MLTQMCTLRRSRWKQRLTSSLKRQTQCSNSVKEALEMSQSCGLKCLKLFCGSTWCWQLCQAWLDQTLWVWLASLLVWCLLETHTDSEEDRSDWLQLWLQLLSFTTSFGSSGLEAPRLKPSRMVIAPECMWFAASQWYQPTSHFSSGSLLLLSSGKFLSTTCQSWRKEEEAPHHLHLVQIHLLEVKLI